MELKLRPNEYDFVLEENEIKLKKEIESLERKIKNKRKLNDILIFSLILCSLSLIIQIIYQIYIGF